MFQFFKIWASSKKGEEKKVLKSKTKDCPSCGKPQTNLKKHLVRKHNVEHRQALGLCNDTNLHKNRPIKPENERKTKRRVYKPSVCPIPGCYKTGARLNNHLRATHKIKDDKQYKEYVKISRTLNIIPEKRLVDSNSEREEEEESELSSSDEEAELYKECEGLKKIILRGAKKYLLRQENEPLSDSDDEDWLFSRVHHHVVLKETSKGN